MFGYTSLWTCETKLIISYYSNQKKILVLIVQYMTTGKCPEAFAVIVVPIEYCQNEYESNIGYEEICT